MLMSETESPEMFEQVQCVSTVKVHHYKGSVSQSLIYHYLHCRKQCVNTFLDSVDISCQKSNRYQETNQQTETRGSFCHLKVKIFQFALYRVVYLYI